MVDPVIEAGLSDAEVAERIRLGRSNAEPDRTSRSLAQIARANLLTRFNALLGGLCLLVLVTGAWQDAVFGLVILINAVIGIAQELRAKTTLDRLALLTAPRARVRRNGASHEIPVAAVVLDDVVEVQRGDQLVADGDVLSSTELELDESLLTGESQPVAKQPGDEVWSGSSVVAGRALIRVTRVGRDSYAHRISADARAFTLTRSELVAGVNRILRWISWALLLVGPLLVWSELRSAASWRGAVTGATAGVVGMVPEGLVLLTSLAFLLGAARLARHKVLVQELPAVEGLARVDVVCVDKTGTLTDGIEFAGLHPTDGGAPAAGTPEVRAALGALASTPNPNVTVAALAGQFPAPPGWSRRREVSFSSARGWSGVDFGEHGSWLIGAPDVLLQEAQGDLLQRATALADSGLRVVLLARTTEPLLAERPPRDVTPAALLTFSESIRPDAEDTIAYFGRQGVRVMIVSGDHPGTLGSIAARIGLPDHEDVKDARELTGDADSLAAAVETCSILGRVTPQQKRDVVLALQRNGHVVAMTGDGVNDVLALKSADIGVAMGSGSAATRAVAQLVLVDDRFAHLPGVIVEGRRVMANIERVAGLFLVKNCYSVLLSTAVAIAGVPFPFVPRQLTAVSALTIGVPAFLLALSPEAPPYRAGFLRRVLGFAVPVGAATGLGAFLSYSVADRLPGPALSAPTAAGATVVVAGFGVLVLLARPLNRWKVAMIASLAGVLTLTLSLPWARGFLLLEPAAGPLAVGTCIGLAIAGLAARLDRYRHPPESRAGGDCGPDAHYPRSILPPIRSGESSE